MSKGGVDQKAATKKQNYHQTLSRSFGVRCKEKIAGFGIMNCANFKTYLNDFENVSILKEIQTCLKFVII